MKTTWSDTQTFATYFHLLIKHAFSFYYFYHQDGIDMYTYLPKVTTSHAIQIQAMMNSVLFCPLLS